MTEPGGRTARPISVRRAASLLVLLLVPLMWLGAEPALACSCVPSTTADFVARADVVASGRLVQRDDVGQNVVYTFSGDERYVGRELAPRFEVTTALSAASCGVTGLVVGRRYLVYMTEERGQLSANSCGGTGPATEGHVDRVEAVTGPGTSFDLPRPAQVEDPVYAVRRLVASLAWWP